MAAEDSGASPGYVAIDEALRRVYGDEPGLYFGTIVPSYLGGPDPLDAIRAFKVAGPTPHWHVIGLGLSEVFGRSSGDPAVSGFGYEFTFRLKCGATEERPPNWAVNLMQNLARASAQYGSVFGVHHTIDANGPIALESATKLTAIAFVLDPLLGSIRTPAGRVDFLQIVGLTADELRAKQEWDCAKLVALLSEGNPLLVTDLDRPSLLEKAETARRIREGIERDGSSSDMLVVSELRWSKAVLRRQAELVLGALVVAGVLAAIRSRLLHGKPFLLSNERDGVGAAFEPAAEPGWEAVKPLLTVRLTPALAREMLETLQPVRGVYRWASLPGFTLKVEATEIKSPRGEVTEIVG
jgi:hypothetical protein